ncbi:uncharacterized protein LOC128667987 [Microplitis demolitor]|uniref:uncharacterized protein LOC128667987 n=1 Tax=Microplitis demolitor TaxID=69319 RepID=UPI00235B6CE6|nr:uncharacterized protein LOC128667987 [Microplitis demolitor]
MSDAKESKIPMDPGYLKMGNTTPRIDNKTYQKIIGSLLYICVNTRPDISAPVTILSQHINDTRQQDWNELQRILRYLKYTCTYELRLSNSSTANKELVGYADANWAESREDRKSNSGYLFKIFGGTVSWCCKKQDCVSISSTETEIVALAETCKEAVWLRELLKFFKQEQLHPTIINEDNQSCINSHKLAGLTNRNKHIDVKHYFARDLEQENVIKLKYCPTESNQADILTKPTGPVRLKTMVDQIGIKAAPQF